MAGKTGTTAHGNARTTRIAWLVTFVVPLVLAALLLAVKPAHAALAGRAIVPLALEEEFEADAEDEGEFEEACGGAEEEFEEGELGEEETEEICEEAEDKSRKRAAGHGSVAPEECLLRSAHARAVADAERNRLKLTVGYTTYEPVAATLEIHGGSAHITSLHRYLGHSGVLRTVENFGKKKAPKRLVLLFHIPGSPHSCQKFQVEKIQVHHR